MNKQITVAILGLGGRCRDAYCSYVYNNPDKIKVVAIADLKRDRVDKIAKMLDVPQDMCFNSDKELFAQGKIADAVFICTQDKDHVENAIDALKVGYHILLEKPISPSIDECKLLEQKAKEYNKHIVVCHVLRYAPFYTGIKKVIDKGLIGDIVTIEASENVGYWHQAHSFVRGNWKNSKETSPMILAKSCHDMDILLWIAGKRCKRVSSFGSISLFKKEKAPVGAPKRCTDGCVHQKECPFDAVDFYIESKKTGVKHGCTSWPVNTVHIAPTPENILEELKTGNYGKCVYHCDNDVVDHQIVNLELEEGSTISFTMTAFSDICNRQIKVMGTKGCIEGDMASGNLWYVEFGKERQPIIIDTESGLSGHGGGDGIMVDDFIELILGNNNDNMGTAIERSIESHVVALLAEQSRINGGKVMEV